MIKIRSKTGCPFQMAIVRDITFNLIAIITLLVLIWSMWTIVSMPSIGIGITLSKEYKVLNINDKAAVSDTIKPGDIIISLNGIPVSELESPFDGLHPGDTAKYLVQRDGQLHYVTLKLKPIPLRSLIMELEPIFVGFVFWLAAILVWLLSPGPGVKQIFFLLGQTTANMFALGAVSTFKSNSFENYLFATTLIFLSPLILHFYLTFPPLKKTKFSKALLYISYTIAALLIFFYFLIFIGVQSPFLRIIESQKVTYSFIFITILIALTSLFSPRGRSSIQSGRQQRLLIAGMLFSILPILIFSILPLIIFGKPLISYVWTFPILTLLPIAYAYAVHEENLERFDRILKRTLGLIAFTVMFIALYFIILVALQNRHIAYRHAPLISGALMSLFAFLSTPTLVKKIDARLDRFFYGHWYDYRSIVQQSSHQLSGTIQLDELVQNLLQNVRKMRFKSAAFLWLQGDKLILYRQYGYPAEIANAFYLQKDDPIAQRLIEIGKPCTSQDIFSEEEMMHLAPEQEVFFDYRQVRIWLPLISGQTNLWGVLLLGPRQLEEGLDAVDWAILDTIADQTSLAAENIHLVETLREQLDRMREMQRELKETKWRLADNREKERLEMAQILHDGPIQDIYGVIYQFAIWRKRHSDEDDKELRAIENELMSIENSLRSFSTELRPPALESFGLEGAIRSHIRKLQETNPNLEVLPDLVSTKNTISAEKKLALFRIYQESVRNAVRHARATKIWVRLAIENEKLQLEIKDNGQGFEIPQKWMDFARQGHLGILGISERAEAIGGKLDVVSSPGQGTIIRVQVELDSAQDDSE